jgi:hypothetical protein
MIYAESRRVVDFSAHSLLLGRRLRQHTPTQLKIARSITAVAAQVIARYLEPCSAYRPISFPYWLIKFVALTIKTVTITDAIPRAKKPRSASVTETKFTARE